MRAAVLHFPRTLRIEDRPVPQPGPGQVAIQVMVSGICGTDLHLYEGRYHRPGLPFAARVLGHDFAGVVTEVGAGVEGIAVGDRVTVEPTRYCGKCAACRAGAPQLCEKWAHMGMSGADGCMQDVVVADQRYVHILPDSVSDEAASVLEPVAVALHVFDQRGKDLKTDDVVVVIGCGPIGLAHVQLAALRGHQVVALDIVPERMQLALDLGASLVLDAREADIPNQVAAHCRHQPNLVIETAGSTSSAQLALQCTTFHGRTVFVALTHDPIPLRSLIEKEIWVTGARTGSGSYGDAIALVASGAFQLDQIISHRYPLEDLRTAFELLLARPGEVFRIAIHHTS